MVPSIHTLCVSPATMVSSHHSWSPLSIPIAYRLPPWFPLTIHGRLHPYLLRIVCHPGFLSPFMVASIHTYCVSSATMVSSHHSWSPPSIPIAYRLPPWFPLTIHGRLHPYLLRIVCHRGFLSPFMVPSIHTYCVSPATMVSSHHSWSPLSIPIAYSLPPWFPLTIHGRLYPYLLRISCHHGFLSPFMVASIHTYCVSSATVASSHHSWSPPSIPIAYSLPPWLPLTIHGRLHPYLLRIVCHHGFLSPFMIASIHTYCVSSATMVSSHHSWSPPSIPIAYGLPSWFPLTIHSPLHPYLLRIVCHPGFLSPFMVASIHTYCVSPATMVSSHHSWSPLSIPIAYSLPPWFPLTIHGRLYPYLLRIVCHPGFLSPFMVASIHTYCVSPATMVSSHHSWSPLSIPIVYRLPPWFPLTIHGRLYPYLLRIVCHPGFLSPFMVASIHTYCV